MVFFFVNHLINLISLILLSHSLTNLIAIANRKLNFSNWIKWIQGQIQYGQYDKSWLYWHVQHGFSEELIPFHQVESPFGPAPRDTAPPLSLHVHVPPACRHLWLSPVEKVTRQSSPESWPAYLVSSRLIIQLVQGRTDTVKSIPTQFDLSDISRFTVIILPTSIILLVKIILFILHDHEIHIFTI